MTVDEVKSKGGEVNFGKDRARVRHLFSHYLFSTLNTLLFLAVSHHPILNGGSLF